MARAPKRKSPKPRSAPAKKKPVKRTLKKNSVSKIKQSPKKKLPTSSKTNKRVTTPKTETVKARIKTSRRLLPRVTKSPARFVVKSTLPSAYETPVSSSEVFRPALDLNRGLPAGYGDNRLVLLVRDPWWIYSYWEMTPALQNEITDRIPYEHRDSRVMVIRVYDVTDTSFDRPNSYFDIELRLAANSWYIDTGMPNRAWGAEIGFRIADGRFWPIVRSNIVRTPRFGFSDVLDEEWMIPDEDFWRLANTFGPNDVLGGSSERSRRQGDWFLRVVSSEGASQFSIKPARPSDAR